MQDFIAKQLIKNRLEQLRIEQPQALSKRKQLLKVAKEMGIDDLNDVSKPKRMDEHYGKPLFRIKD